MRPFSAGTFWSTRFGSVVLAVAALAALQFLIVPKLNTYDIRLLVLAMLFGSLAVSLNLINGITGQFSMGHAGFYAIGAYVSGKITMTFYEKVGVQDPIWMIVVALIAGVAAAIAGFIVGLPSLRLKGDYLAIVTLGFGEIVRIFVINQDGGDQSIFGLDLGGAAYLKIPHKVTEVAYVGLLLILAIAVSRNLLKTARGLTFLATREDELAAAAVGVNTTRTKVTAFVIGAVFAGIAGSLYAHYNGSIAPDDFTMDVSFLIVTMVVIGGTGSITGAAIAGISLKLFEETLRNFPPISALRLIAVVLSIAITVGAMAPLAKKVVKGSPVGRKVLSVVGYLGCAGLILSAYLNFHADVSPVLKTAFIGLCIATVVAFLFTKAKSGLPAFGFTVVMLGVVYLVQIPLTKGISAIPYMAREFGQTTYTPSDLRWALFALTLIVVMLNRPEGILGSHEYSWSFVRNLFGKRAPKVEVPA